jgi:hypothetical protein
VHGECPGERHDDGRWRWSRSTRAYARSEDALERGATTYAQHTHTHRHTHERARAHAHMHARTPSNVMHVGVMTVSERVGKHMVRSAEMFVSAELNIKCHTQAKRRHTRNSLQGKIELAFEVTPGVDGVGWTKDCHLCRARKERSQSSTPCQSSRWC